VQPTILEYTRRYDFVGQLHVPEKFHTPTTGPLIRGVRSNASLESLTLSPDERRLFTAVESPLVQDGEAASSKAGGLVRVIEYQSTGRTFVPAREFAYPIDPLPAPPFVPGFQVTGLVELVSLGGDDFLALERGYAEEAPRGRSVNHIRIFRMTLRGASDVSSLDSLRGTDVRTASKTLLLDLSTVRGLSPELSNLDNFEGMTFGPTLPDGSRTLLLVSDDNFNARQRTSFLWFRVVETP
jgi:3-phytase